MKRSKKILASLLCAAMLCIPTLAAGAYVPDPQYTTTWGVVTRQDNGSLLVQKPSETKPTDGVVFWTENTMILDAVSGDPVDADAIKTGETVYAWMGARSVTTMSLPPQTTPDLLLVNVPADYKVPQYDVIVRSDGLVSLGIPGRGGMSITLSDGTTYQVWEDAQVTSYLTRNRVTYQDLLPGTRVLVWADGSGKVSRVLVFPYEYKGSISLDGYGRLYINGGASVDPSSLRRPYKDERLYVPIRAVAEALGMSVRWDAKQGAVVSYGDDMVKPAPLTTETLMTAMPGGAIAAVNSDGTTEEVYGTCVKEAGVTYVSRSALAQALDLYLAD